MLEPDPQIRAVWNEALAKHIADKRVILLNCANTAPPTQKNQKIITSLLT